MCHLICLCIGIIHLLDPIGAIHVLGPVGSSQLLGPVWAQSFVGPCSAHWTTSQRNYIFNNSFWETTQVIVFPICWKIKGICWICWNINEFASRGATHKAPHKGIGMRGYISRGMSWNINGICSTIYGICRNTDGIFWNIHGMGWHMNGISRNMNGKDWNTYIYIYIYMCESLRKMN